MDSESWKDEFCDLVSDIEVEVYLLRLIASYGHLPIQCGLFPERVQESALQLTQDYLDGHVKDMGVLWDSAPF